MIKQNPYLNVDIPKQQRKGMTALSPEQAASFLSAIKDNRYGTLFSLMLATGIRPSEALALQWNDIDWQRGAITILRNSLDFATETGNLTSRRHKRVGAQFHCLRRY